MKGYSSHQVGHFFIILSESISNYNDLKIAL